MKKPILLLLSLCLLTAVFCACAKKVETPTPDVREDPASTPLPSGVPETEAPAPEAPDPEATAFVSAESLAQGIRQARETAAQDRTEAQSVLAELDELYAPDADFDGFTLLGVEAQEDYLIYYYMPDDGPAYDGFDYRRGISVAVCTDPAVTLEQVCGQMGLTVGPDGFALDAEHDQLLFEQDGHTCSLQMPEGTDPETMKAFCRITTIPLN